MSLNAVGCNLSLILMRNAFIVYPSGSILEMSNGYPHSTSPLGGSPSPGPSPGIGGHHHKCKHVVSCEQCNTLNQTNSLA